MNFSTISAVKESGLCLKENHGCVIVQTGAIGEPANVLENALCGHVGLLQMGLQAVRSVLFAIRTLGLGYAIAVKNQPRAFWKMDFAFREVAEPQSQWNPAFRVQKA